MATLPFLMVHGAVVWKVLLVAGTVGVLALVSWLRRRSANAAARRAAAALEARTEPGVVRGTLGGGVVMTVVATQPVDDDVVVDDRPDEVWIETGEGRVMLDGAIRVAAGSRAVAARNGVPAATPDALVVKGSLHRKRLRRRTVATATLSTISPGDEVIAFGVLDTVPSSDEADHRTNASMRVLKPLADAPIALVARRPRGAAPRLPLIAAIALAAVTPFIGWKIEAGLGEAWRSACWDTKESAAGPIALSNTDACALAMAMPGSRANAIGRISMQLERSAYRDERTLDTVLALDELAGDCKSELQHVERAERYEQALTVARRCGDRRAEYGALLELGRFDEAAAVTVPAAPDLAALPTGATLVLAGRWTEAAAAADRRAAAIRARGHKPDKQRSVDLTARSYQCLGELLRFDGGDAAALGRLRALAAGSDGGVCAPELADSVPEPERAAVLATNEDHLIPSSAILAKLGSLTTVDDYSELTSAEAVLGQPDDFVAAKMGVDIWLAETTPPPAADAPAAVRTNLERWQAVAAVLGGDFAAARAHAARAIAAAPHDEQSKYRFLEVGTLPALVAFYAGDPVDYTIPPPDSIDRELWLHAFGRLLLRNGDPLIEGTDFGPELDYPAALEAAARGDASSLVNFMGNGDFSWWADADIIAVLPRVKVGRDALARQLAWSAPQDDDRLAYNFPWSVALHAAVRRSALQLAGDSTEAARWAAIYRRYDQALRDRRKVVALALWNL